MASKRAAQFLAAAVALQILFAIIIAAVTSSTLDTSRTTCYLNILPGRVCDFVYVSVGFSLFFSLLIAVGTFFTLRQRENAFLPSVNGAIACFAAFWWMVTSITITQRGKQAVNANLPQDSARLAVIVLSWMEFVLFLLSFAAVTYDRIAYRRYRVAEDRSQFKLDVEQSSSDSKNNITNYLAADSKTAHLI